MLIVAVAITFYYLDRARKGKKLAEIRKLAPITAIEEAVGRATEMAKPIVFSYGWGGIVSADRAPMTLSAINLLTYTTRLAAKQNAPIKVSAFESATLPLVESSMYEAYVAEGHPENFNRDNIVYMADSQYPWAAGTLGMIRREKPAAVISVGFFWGDALMIVAAGALSKAIQIAGSAQIDALPWFAAACDYCLIGEELYAAAAYVSKEPRQIATIIAEDILKIVVLGILGVGVILTYAGASQVLQLLRW